MSRLNTRQTRNMHDIGVQVELIAQLHVERLQLTGSAEVGSRQNAFQANLVLPDGRHDILEWWAQRRIDLGEEEWLEVDGNADRFEDFLHRVDELRTNTIARNERARCPSFRLCGTECRGRVDVPRRRLKSL